MRGEGGQAWTPRRRIPSSLPAGAPQPDSQWVCVHLVVTHLRILSHAQSVWPCSWGSPPPADKQLVIDFKRTEVTWLLRFSG